MKNLTLFSLFAVLLCLSVPTQAFVLAPVAPEAPAMEQKTDITVAQFLEMTPESYAVKTGKKMKWGQRMAMKAVQKRMQKQLQKGTINAEDASNGGNLISLLSMIFGLTSFLLLLVSILSFSGGAAGLLALLFGLTGFIMGIVGLKKEDSLGMALVGTITGGLVVLLFLLAIILVAAFVF